MSTAVIDTTWRCRDCTETWTGKYVAASVTQHSEQRGHLVDPPREKENA